MIEVTTKSTQKNRKLKKTKEGSSFSAFGITFCVAWWVNCINFLHGDDFAYETKVDESSTWNFAVHYVTSIIEL